MNDPRRTWPILVMGVTILSGGAIFARLASAPPLMVAGLRCAFAVMFLLGLSPLFREPWRSLNAKDRRVAILGGFLLAIHLGTWIASLGKTTIAMSLLLVSTAPIWALLLEISFLRVKSTPRQWLAVGIAIVGAGSVGFGPQEGSSSFEGLALALVSGITMGAYITCGKLREEPTRILPYAVRVYAWAASALILVAIPLGQFRLDLPAASFGWILLMAFCSQVIGHTTVNWAVPRLGATSVGIALLLEPIWASVFGVIVFGEIPPRTVFFSGALVLTGLVLVLTSPSSVTAEKR